MKIVDAFILARTKRKTRRIRTALVILISGLMFAVLFFISFAIAGLLQSVDQVKDVGFNSRYLTYVMSTGRAVEFENYEAERKKIENQMDAELRARGITVSDQTRFDASYQAEFMRRMSAVTETFVAESKAAFEEWLRMNSKHTARYMLTGMGIAEGMTFQADYAKDVRVEMLESAARTQKEPQDTTPLAGLQFYTVEQDMLRTQLAPGQTFSWQPGQPIPVILPYPYLEKLAGTSFANVDTATRNQGYRDMINTYSGKIVDFCYRNAPAREQLQAVVLYNHTANTDTDATTKPLAIPVCADMDQAQLIKLGIIQAKSDVKPLFEQPPAPAALTQRIQFRIAGFMPARSDFGNSDILSRIFFEVNALPMQESPAIIPKEVSDQLPIFVADPNSFKGLDMIFLDFASRADQKALLDQGCVANECMNGDKPILAPFGNLSVALERPLHFISMATLIGVIGTVIIAALMILFTISKTIADSSKEIAVFRALGARRRDIAQIYFTYGGMLACNALVTALLLGLIGVFTLDYLIGDTMAAELIKTVGAYTLEVPLGLVGFEPLWIVGGVAALALASFIGVSIPVIATLRRKLITILREE